MFNLLRRGRRSRRAAFLTSLVERDSVAGSGADTCSTI